MTARESPQRNVDHRLRLNELRGGDPLPPESPGIVKLNDAPAEKGSPNADLAPRGVPQERIRSSEDRRCRAGI
jgi:hypothetical protein